MPIPESADASPATYKIKVTGGGVNVDGEVDAATASEIVRLAMGGAPVTAAASTPRARKRAMRGTRARGVKGDGGATTKPKRRASGSPGLVKDLNLRPGGKTSFEDFVAEKLPTSHRDKQAVIVYWLRHMADISNITLDHVNTCYVNAGWTRPTNFANSLAATAAQKGWLDTSDMTSIGITTLGEDQVTHGLPAKSKK